jgi:DNA gyrase subunit A
VIIKELREVQKTFGDDRRTQIIDDPGDINIEDLVQKEDVAVTVTAGGYVKRTSLDTYRRQVRGGKGRIGMAMRSEDIVEHLVIANTHTYLLIFTNKGRVYWLKIYSIPEANPASKGKNINGLLNLQAGETVKAFLSVDKFTPDKYIVMATARGVVKKTDLTAFSNPMSRGIIAIRLDEEDELISARVSGGEDFVFIATREGKAIRFLETAVRSMGRPARGVRAIRLAEGDYVVGMEVMQENDLVLSVSELGYGKRTALRLYRVTNRGGKGVINMKTTKRVGKVLGILQVKDDTDLMLITDAGKIIRTDSSDVRKVGRSASGVKLVRLSEGDMIASACVVTETMNGNGKDDEDDGQGNLPLQ